MEITCNVLDKKKEGILNYVDGVKGLTGTGIGGCDLY